MDKKLPWPAAPAGLIAFLDIYWILWLLPPPSLPCGEAFPLRTLTRFTILVFSFGLVDFRTGEWYLASKFTSEVLSAAGKDVFSTLDPVLFNRIARLSPVSFVAVFEAECYEC